MKMEKSLLVSKREKGLPEEEQEETEKLVILVHARHDICGKCKRKPIQASHTGVAALLASTEHAIREQRRPEHNASFWAKTSPF